MNRYTPFLLTSLSLPLLATPTTASLSIKVRDEKGRPVSGHRLRLLSRNQGWEKWLSTDGQGLATAQGLGPGSYLLQGRPIELQADETLQIHLLVQPNQAIVEVSAYARDIATSSIGVQTRLDARDLASLPLPVRRFTEQSLFAPGVNPSGKPEPSVLGSMLDANQFSVDGMTTNLSSTGRFGMNLSNEILESQTLTTGGHKAEIGFSPGAVFSLVTKSGGNTLTGSFYTSRIFRGLNDKPKAGEVNTPEERPTDLSAWGLTLSGPLVKDCLFFFLGFDRQMASLDFENVQPIGYPAHRRSQDEDRSYRFVKLTWLPTQDQRLELSYFGDPVFQHHFDTAGNSSVKDEQLTDRSRGGDSYLLSHIWNLANTLSWQNTFGRHQTRFLWRPAYPDAGPFRSQLNAPYGESFGRYSEDRLERILNWTLRSELSLFWGEHRFKGGFQGLRSDYTLAFRRRGASGGEGFVDRAEGGSGPSTSALKEIQNGLKALHGTDFGYSITDSLTSPSPVSGQLLGGRKSFLYQRILADLAEYGSPLRQQNVGFYLQDDWNPNAHWCFNVGLRTDRVRLTGEDGRELYGQTLTSPRLGLSWDPNGDNVNRLFVYAGHIFSPPTPGSLASAGATTGAPLTTRQVWIPSLQQWRSYQITGTGKAPAALLAPGLQAARTDLYQLGYQAQIGEWQGEAVGTLKRTRNLMDTYDPKWGYLQAQDLGMSSFPSGIQILGNLPGLKRDFRGLDLSLHRRFEAGHSLHASASIGDFQGNSEVGNVATLSGTSSGSASIPSLRQDYRGTDGPLNESLKFALKTWGRAQLPWNLELTGFLYFRTGQAYSLLVRGSDDQLVLQPGHSRGDQNLPSATTLDLGLAYARKLGVVDFRAQVDIFNATNTQPLTIIQNVGPALSPGNHLQPRSYQFTLRMSY